MVAAHGAAMVPLLFLLFVPNHAYTNEAGSDVRLALAPPASNVAPLKETAADSTQQSPSAGSKPADTAPTPAPGVAQERSRRKNGDIESTILVEPNDDSNYSVQSGIGGCLQRQTLLLSPSLSVHCFQSTWRVRT